jgi:hypothetical protein
MQVHFFVHLIHFVHLINTKLGTCDSSRISQWRQYNIAEDLSRQHQTYRLFTLRIVTI